VKATPLPCKTAQNPWVKKLNLMVGWMALFMPPFQRDVDNPAQVRVRRNSNPRNNPMNLSSTLPRKACSVFAVVAVLLVLSSRLMAAAPGGPTVTVNDQPVAVTVTGPVEVQGYVEVLNDALKTVFNKRVTGQMEPTHTRLSQISQSIQILINSTQHHPYFSS
jgi:hypothetical protein